MCVCAASTRALAVSTAAGRTSLWSKSSKFEPEALRTVRRSRDESFLFSLRDGDANFYSCYPSSSPRVDSLESSKRRHHRLLSRDVDLRWQGRCSGLLRQAG